MNVSDLDLVNFSLAERRVLERGQWELERRGQACRSVEGRDPIMLYKAEGRQSNATMFVIEGPAGTVSESVRTQTTTQAEDELALLRHTLQRHLRGL